MLPLLCQNFCIHSLFVSLHPEDSAVSQIQSIRLITGKAVVTEKIPRVPFCLLLRDCEAWDKGELFSTIINERVLLLQTQDSVFHYSHVVHVIQTPSGETERATGTGVSLVNHRKNYNASFRREWWWQRWWSALTSPRHLQEAARLFVEEPMTKEAKVCGLVSLQKVSHHMCSNDICPKQLDLN